MKLSILVLAGVSSIALAAAPEPIVKSQEFDPENDLLSLHYDHAPDKDDGQSAAADRTILESLYGQKWIEQHVVAVSGAYGKNARRFNPDSDVVMDAAWHDSGGWLAAHTNREDVITRLCDRWRSAIQDGGDVWVKEGGQSDLTVDVIKRLRRQLPDLDLRERIHVVQHSDWNENQTTDAALDYVKAQTDYIRIRDANAYLNIRGGNEAFEKAATHHPEFGAAWKAAFAYYPPDHRLDFSDTGELMRILELGEMSIDEFWRRFLVDENQDSSDDG